MKFEQVSKLHADNHSSQNPSKTPVMAALIPVRRGEHVKCCRSRPTHSKSFISFKQRRSTFVLGRPQLLSCLYAACGCSSNIYSTRKKCGECSQVQWAARRLSREMLRIVSSEDDGRYTLSVRGSYAAVVVTDPSGHTPRTVSTVDSSTRDPNEWRGKEIIQHGSRISLREPDGEGHLDFVFVTTEPRDCARFNTQQKLTIHLVPLGQDMPRQRVTLLRQLLEKRGYVVTGDFMEASHLVVSDLVPDMAELASHLGCSQNDLQGHLDKNRVQCLTPRWLLRGRGTDEGLSLHSVKDSWMAYCQQGGRTRTDTVAGNTETRLLRRTKTNNVALAAEFTKLSKQYDSGPIWPEEEWKALQFHRLAGRLQCLDFEIKPESFASLKQRLKSIPLISTSAIGMIGEYIHTGTIRRISDMDNDPMRAAIRNLKTIHGIGAVGARNLYQKGYTNIQQIRQACRSGELELSRDQQIGVECYEDFREAMLRDEVAQIGEIVISAFHSLNAYHAEATIMGSFRRGKLDCGDVDILISMEDHKDTVPSEALPCLVDLLFNRGHVAYHLNYLQGMETWELGSTPRTPGNPENPPQTLSKQPAERQKRVGRKGPSTSYMGVFNSPKFAGKRRRVDIKVYPYNKRGFAFLYFTGSKWFNRSMRQWATQRFNWKLSDKGLFDIVSGKSVLRNASCEEAIFRKLKLKYKEPRERVYFDDVEPK